VIYAADCNENNSNYLCRTTSFSECIVCLPLHNKNTVLEHLKVRNSEIIVEIEMVEQRTNIHVKSYIK
jgi:hypothetical protein